MWSAVVIMPAHAMILPEAASPIPWGHRTESLVTGKEVRMMTTERHAWASLHRPEPGETRPAEACACGQELDTCTRRHCPRCGSSLAPRAA